MYPHPTRIKTNTLVIKVKVSHKMPRYVGEVIPMKIEQAELSLYEPSSAEMLTKGQCYQIYLRNIRRILLNAIYIALRIEKQIYCNLFFTKEFFP